jgi:phosphohistidine swiveling domain-containing protein
MSFISESRDLLTKEAVGGKGFHLQKLVSWGAPVPPFFVITTESHRHYLNNKKIPDKVVEKFSLFFEKYSQIALRSSMTSEDHADASFAGLFDTHLNVTKKNWQEALLKIYDSINSNRVKEYIQKKKIKSDLLMAVVAQEMVQVEKSGVIFTRSPVFPTSALAIDAAFGLGEGVVSGTADVDHYQFTRTNELIEKRTFLDLPVLNAEELKKVTKLALEMEKKINCPSDLEWGFKDNDLFLFQIRPITRSFEPLTYLVDTNLSESYPGAVSPFTADFVKKAYENVFKESAEILGARGKRLSTLGYHYSKLISCVDNHLYYNLEHYYAALRALPGGEKNIKNWHQMIGGNISGQEIPHHSTEPSYIESIISLFSLVKLALNRKRVFNPFLQSLEGIKLEIEAEIKNHASSQDLINYLYKLVNRPLKFGLTVINDIFIMAGLGYLVRVTKKKGFKEEAVIDLLKTSNSVDSIKPLEVFNEMVQQIDSSFIEEFGKMNLKPGHNPYEEIFQELTANGRIKEVTILENFLNKFGDRSFEELKLESLPMKNDPVLLNELLKWAKINPSVKSGNTKQHIQFSPGWLDRKVINFTRECVENREATRLWRGKFYHLLRQLILNLHAKLITEDETWNEFEINDFFSVTHHEWKKFSEGKLTREEIHSLMEKRKSWKTDNRNYPELIVWSEGESLPMLDISIPEGHIQGQGVSSGTIEGIALVLDNPHEALHTQVENTILVTRNTDPAWVYIMSRCSGLISEKGSLLSHTAIIGRELNIPTIVGVKHATLKIKNGDRLRMDATSGTIKII